MRAGTRALSWLLNYLRVQCQEIIDIFKQNAVECKLIIDHSDDYEYHHEILQMENIIKTIFRCQVNKGNVYVDELWKNAAILKENCVEALFDYKGEVLRQEINVNLLYIWNKRYREGYRVKEFFEKRNYKKIAIYGAGYLGKLLFDELREDGIDVNYFIDKEVEKCCGTKVKKPTEYFCDVDVVVITVVHLYKYIKSSLICNADVVSLEMIIRG